MLDGKVYGMLDRTPTTVMSCSRAPASDWRMGGRAVKTKSSKKRLLWGFLGRKRVGASAGSLGRLGVEMGWQVCTEGDGSVPGWYCTWGR